MFDSVILEVSGLCNARCPYCMTGKEPIHGRKKTFMSLNKVKDVIERLNYLEIVKRNALFELYNWGEPFLNKDILNMITLCKEAGIHTHIDSTLSSMDFSEDYAERLVHSGISSIFVSIDGTTQEVYEKYRVGGNIDRVINNIQKINYAKKI